MRNESFLLHFLLLNFLLLHHLLLQHRLRALPFLKNESYLHLELLLLSFLMVLTLDLQEDLHLVHQYFKGSHHFS